MSNINFDISKEKLSLKNSRHIELQFVQKRFITFALFCTSLMWYGCKSDKTKMPVDSDLIGRWSVFYSAMNNKPNDLMEEAYFDFLDESKVKSNLFEGQSYNYTIVDGGLKIDNPDQFLLDIDFFQNDTLILSGKLKYYNLTLKMVKLNPM